MKKQLIIMDFTGVYNYEPFICNQNCIWLDCRHLYGTECYCDEEGAASLKRLIADYPAEGIHFIDSGNYHYLTKFWTDKLNYPFSLLVFDHHPDMQPPLFEDMISCGSWVKDMLDTNPYLQKVVVAGASEALIRAVPDIYRDRVRFYGEKALKQEETWKRFASEHVNEPVYISIDKDVLNPESAVTNWDQGSLSFQELEQLLAVVFRHEKIAGIDICGECSATLDLFEEKREAAINGRANQELLELISSFRTPTEL